MAKRSAALWKAALAALGLSALLAGAFLMPLTLSQGALSVVPFAASHYCPESGEFAERYFRSSSARSSPDDYVICLGKGGERISDKRVYNRILRDVWLVWTLVLFPLFFLSFKALFGPNAKRSVGR